MPARSAWVQVRQGDNVGWVHRSTVQAWHREVIVRPHPTAGGDYREYVGFPQGLDTRDPGGVNYTRQPPGNYQLGPPDAGGHRPVYDWQGKPDRQHPGGQGPAFVPQEGRCPAPATSSDTDALRVDSRPLVVFGVAGGGAEGQVRPSHHPAE